MSCNWDQKEAVTIDDWQFEVHMVAIDHGWWGKNPNIPEKLALINSEVSEALEDYREDNMELSYDGEKPVGFGIELADAAIRILDLAEYLNISIDDMIRIKNNYNKTRAYRHGGKKA